MRYAPQELYKNIGKAGQRKLAASHVAVAGLGAVGSHAAELLARSGVGRLSLLDRDIVEESNLSRQSLYTEADVGRPKAAAAARALRRIDRGLSLSAACVDLTPATVGRLGRPSLILGCLDTLEAQLLLSDYSLKQRIPFLYASAVADRGQLFESYGRPCLACALSGKRGLTCADNGILGACSSLVASLAAARALKMLLGGRDPGRFLSVDAWEPGLEAFVVRPRPGCPSCDGPYPHLRAVPRPVRLCGRGSYQIVGPKAGISRLRKLFPGGRALGGVYSAAGATFFPDGRIYLKAGSEEEARKKAAPMLARLGR